MSDLKHPTDGKSVAGEMPVKVIDVHMEVAQHGGQHVGDDRGASASGQRTRPDPRADALRPAGTTKPSADDCGE